MFLKKIFPFVPVIALVLAMCPMTAIANPDDAVPPTPDGSIGIYSGGSSANRDPDDNTVGIEEGDKLRDEQGIVSQLSTDTHNPYNGQIRLDIDIGSEFAEFEGSDVTEGIRIKITPGGIVELPKLKARDGYYFVGWGQGGVPYEPTWDPMTREVEMDTDTSNGKNTSIFALYADEEGNGYCTCGSYEKGIYAEKMDEIKAMNEAYNKSNGYMSSVQKTIAIVVAIVLLFAILCLAVLMDLRDEKRGNIDYL